jgi:IS30 family transposase
MKNKHLTDHDRLEIEHGIKHGLSFKKIAAQLGKHHTSISREVQSRRTSSDKGAAGRITNRCRLRASCERTQLCMDKPDCTRRCCSCLLCNALCPGYVEQLCIRLSRPPYVCNGCSQESRCTLRKQYYLHNLAQKSYREKLVSCREGANIEERELLAIEAVLGPLVKNGQSIHHVVVNNPDSFSVNVKTLYRYVNGGLLKSPRRGDMPRSCMLKPRRRKPVEHKVDAKCRLGRTYAEFKAFVQASPDTPVVELDSVIGVVGGKALLTITLKSCGLQFAFLRDRNDSQSVIDVFARLRATLGEALFARVFTLLLADNGSEFSNPTAIECDGKGVRTSRLFYCNPCASWQKGAAERNHEFIRMVLPKGTSFDALRQQDVDLLMSHVNSYSRPMRADRSPYDLFGYLYGADVLGKLGLRRIDANAIVLKPALLLR